MIILFLGFTVERFVTQGTLFGYQVRNVKSKSSIRAGNNSGSLVGADKANLKKTKACRDISAEKISNALGDDFNTLGSLAPDITKPNLSSSCIFTSPTTKVTVSIFIREFADEGKASKIIGGLSNSDKIEDLTTNADEGIYNAAANQLTIRKGKRVVTITVTKNSEEKFDKKATALKVINAVL